MPATKTVLSFSSEQAAWLTVDALEPINVPCAVSGSGSKWAVDVYDDGALTPAVLSEIFSDEPPAFAEPPRTEIVPDIDWVTASQSMLAPVRAGRFIIHGSHDRMVARQSRMAIEIDAGRAFGTAHHASTFGCLIAIDRLMRKEAIHSVLDLGTGSGVLAIAAIKAGRHRIDGQAIDIDPVAVEIARLNARLNGVSARLKTHVDDGRVLTGGIVHYDLTIANILARPLLQLAGRIAASTQIGGFTILAGFTNEQAREVIPAYLDRRYRKHSILQVDGWTTAVLQRV